jgi:hypothetical protein
MYRRKYIHVLAFKLEVGSPMPDWIVNALERKLIEPVADLGINRWGEQGMIVRTHEGSQIAMPGFWIVQGREGDLFALSDAAFHNQYELITEGETT